MSGVDQRPGAREEKPGGVDADRSFVNNPFAQALHPPRPKRTLLSWVALGMVSIVGALIMTAAFVLPLMFAYGLLTGGWQQRRWGMLATGVLVVALYLAVLARSLRSWRAGRKPSA